MEYETRSVEDFHGFAAEFAARLVPRRSGALVLALSGELGAGKTTFVQQLARFFGVKAEVTSPTFVIEKVYELTGQPWQRLVHIDAYRLQDAHELEVLHWKERVSDPETLICIEWPERVEALIPERALRIRFDIDDERRIITVHGEESSKENE